MARLLINGEWYERLASTAYYEAAYERLIQEQARTLYPGYRLVPFKTTVASEAGTAKADFALISDTYGGWLVVEVELAHHSLGSHVLPQIEVLATATYGDTQAAYLVAQDRDLDPQKVRELMKGAQPRVLVIVNGLPASWAPVLARFDTLLNSIEVYRSGRNHHVLRVEGGGPEQNLAVVSLCRVDPIIPRLLQIDSPAALDVDPDGLVRLEWNGSETTWSRVHSKDSAWLNPIQTNPLPARETLVIVREGDRLLIRREADISEFLVEGGP
jgi:hypothetical protein